MDNYRFYINRHDVGMLLSGGLLLTTVMSSNRKARVMFGILGISVFLGETIRVSDEEVARWGENGKKVADKIYDRITKKDNDTKDETPEQ